MRRLRLLLAFTVTFVLPPGLAVAQVEINPVPGLVAGSTIASPLAGDLELRDPAQLAGESLTNGALTAGTSWSDDATDFDLVGDVATYTHAVGSGYIFQSTAQAAISWASAGINGWFSFTYTTSAVTGSPVCTLDNGGTRAPNASQSLTEAAGTYTIVFQAKPTTLGDFLLQCTSASAATITFDTLSLKQISGGDLTVQGAVVARLYATVGGAPTIASATTIAPTKAITFISGVTTIETITAPSSISAGGGQITLIPTGVFLTGVTGNIALASTSVVSKALIMTYDVATAKWYPSY